MNRKIRLTILLVFLLLQIVIDRYAGLTGFSFDVLFLIIVYVGIKDGAVKTILTAMFLGWVTDYFTEGVIGVFGFSRVVAGIFIYEVSKFIDLKSKAYIFIMIFVSMVVSNGLANLFFHFIRGYDFLPGMVLLQPFLTGLLALALISFTKLKKIFDVY